MKTKITKRKALNLFKKNRIIYLKPSKLSEQCMDKSPWYCWCKIQLSNLTDIEQQNPEYHFKRIVNEYYYYNCTSYVGNVVNFYYYE